MGLKSALFTDWSSFISDWCLNSKPGFSQKDADAAFSALEKCFPQYLEKFMQTGAKGISAIAPLVHMGTLIEQCQTLSGFEKVMNRLRKGDGSAESELKFAASLMQLGYKPELEPALANRKLDALIHSEENPIYFEVITPETSQIWRQIEKDMLDLAENLASDNLGSQIDIFISSEISTDVVSRCRNYAREASFSEKIVELPGIGFLRKQLSQSATSISELIPSGAISPVIGIAYTTNEGNVCTSIYINTFFSDKRAARLMEKESKHFQKKGEIYVLVIDVSRIPRGIEMFSPLIQRRFQPKINRSFTAVILFSNIFSAGTGTPKYHWHVLRNPYAHKELPASFDESLILLSKQRK